MNLFLQLLPIVWIFLLWSISRYKPNFPLGWVMVPLPLILFLYYVSFLYTNDFSPIQYSISWIEYLHFNLSFHIDGISLFFLLLITGVGTIVVVYSIDYFKHKNYNLFRFYAFLSIFIFAMVGIVTSDEILLLYFFWELTSIASF
jgi:multicomponent Na+:H+ antiporter subunit A